MFEDPIYFRIYPFILEFNTLYIFKSIKDMTSATFGTIERYHA